METEEVFGKKNCSNGRYSDLFWFKLWIKLGVCGKQFGH